MGTISVSLPADGETIEAADYNTPVTTIVNAINGNLDNANIATSAAIDGSKLADRSVLVTKIDASDGQSINDTSNNELVEFGVTSSAVNHIKVTNKATTVSPVIEATGGDTNINLSLTGKGTGGAVFKNPYKFSVYRSSALNSVNSFTKIDFDTTTYDTGSNVTGNDRFVAPIAGTWHFSATAGNTLAGGPIQVALYKNGAVAKKGSEAGTSSSGSDSHVSGDILLAATDYVEVFFIGGNGSVMAVGAENCFFDGHLIST